MQRKTKPSTPYVQHSSMLQLKTIRAVVLYQQQAETVNQVILYPSIQTPDYDAKHFGSGFWAGDSPGQLGNGTADSRFIRNYLSSPYLSEIETNGFEAQPPCCCSEPTSPRAEGWCVPPRKKLSLTTATVLLTLLRLRRRLT